MFQKYTKLSGDTFEYSRAQSCRAQSYIRKTFMGQETPLSAVVNLSGDTFESVQSLICQETPFESVQSLICQETPFELVESIRCRRNIHLSGDTC